MTTEDVDWLDLPGRWTYGVCSDGRIFFVKYALFLLCFSFLVSNARGVCRWAVAKIKTDLDALHQMVSVL